MSQEANMWFKSFAPSSLTQTASFAGFSRKRGGRLTMRYAYH